MEHGDGFDDKFLISSNDGYAHGNLCENPLDNYSMDDIKQLISTNHISNYFVDHEIKKEETSLYY